MSCVVVTILLFGLFICHGDIYLSSSGNDTDSCRIAEKPCRTWDYAIKQLDAIDHYFFVQPGTYNVTYYFTATEAGTWNIIGQSSSPSKVILVPLTNWTSLFDLSFHLTYVLFANFTYYPFQGLNTQMINMTHGVSMSLSDIIIKGTN